MRVLAVFTALLAVAFAASPLEARQQGVNCELIHGPDNCANHGQVMCDGSGNVLVCCDRCY
ncbi:uncharacterized protein BDV17DRAFT_291715 [Aspergillus undulatus]|uniref:uncharacterized protein n=1 Tax=Aspergillus undulatus TaxID=1810928 RepID=UPI003CCE1626